MGSPSTLSAPACSRMNSGSYLRRCASTRGHTASKTVSSAPGGTGMLSLVRAAPDLMLAAGSRVQESPVLVDVGEDQIRVAFEAVENPVAVMGVDVDVGD